MLVRRDQGRQKGSIHSLDHWMSMNLYARQDLGWISWPCRVGHLTTLGLFGLGKAGKVLGGNL